MPGKDDPLQSSQPGRPGYRTESRTLWLEPGGMEEARENYKRAYLGSLHLPQGLVEQAGPWSAEAIWDLSWAAAIAAFSFVQEGRIAPKS